MNIPILPQFAENQKTIEIDGAVIRQDQYGALDALNNVIAKIKAKEFLTFEEQCVVMVATVSMASDVGCKARW